MMKQTSPLDSSREIYLPSRISLNSKIVGISRFSNSKKKKKRKRNEKEKKTMRGREKENGEREREDFPGVPTVRA